MRYFRQLCFTLALFSLTSHSNAQLNDDGMFGSYQSILARAGYGNEELEAAGIQPKLARRQSSQEFIIDAPSQPTEAIETRDKEIILDTPESTVDYGGSYSSPTWGNTVLPNRVGGSPIQLSNCDPRGNFGAPTGCGSGACEACQQAGNRQRNANLVGGVFGITFRRDYEDDLCYGYNLNGDTIDSTDADLQSMNGLGASLARRNECGKGWESIFWYLEDEATASLEGTTFTHLTGLDSIDHTPSGDTIEDIYNAGCCSEIYRDTEILNFEFNLLRNGGEYTMRGCQKASFEFYGGFRLFSFDESIRYGSHSGDASYPSWTEYQIDANNMLAGFQLGCRNEISLTDRIRLTLSGSGGGFSNFIETQQVISDDNGYMAMDYSSSANQISLLGQFDAGLSMQVSRRLRAQVGYRLLGISGVSLAGDQVPYNFGHAYDLENSDVNGSLLLHGMYYGGEFCF
ncbi:MAG: hypothetical protein OSA89_09635 [Mariniblastus sp.]|nr:hypothetical protein [Mariniblastus sp.]